MRTPAETVGERDNTCADPAMKTLKEDEEALAAMKDAVASSWKQMDLSASAKKRFQDVVRRGLKEILADIPVLPPP